MKGFSLSFFYVLMYNNLEDNGDEKMNLEKLEESIGYTFKNKELLKNALTHTSYANENNIQSNEKLEFLNVFLYFKGIA